MVYPTNYKTITDATYYPINLNDTKEHLRITGDDEDSLIESYIAASTRICENYENRIYCAQTISVHYNYFGSKLLLPLNSVIQIDSITYKDQNNVEQTLSSTLYELDNYNCPALIMPTYNSTYPTVLNVSNSITVNYTAGYSSDPSNLLGIPSETIHAVKIGVTTLYENRGDSDFKMPDAMKYLLCHRVFF